MLNHKLQKLLLLPTVLLIAGCTFKSTTTPKKSYMSRQYTFIGATKYEEGFEKKEKYDVKPYLVTDKQHFYFNFKYDASFEINIGYIDETLTFNKKGTYYEKDNYVYMFNSDGSEYMTILATLPSSINGYAGINSIRIEHDLVVDKVSMKTEKIHLWGVGEFDTPHIWE